MITNEVMTPIADEAAARYGQVLDSLRLLFRDTVAGPDFGRPAAADRVQGQAYEIASAFAAAEFAHIVEAFAQIASEGHRDALAQIGADDSDELPEAASELVSESETYLRLEILIQLERDIAYLMQALRRATLQVQLAARSQRVSQFSAVMQYRIGDVSPLQFAVRDRGNNTWPSRKLVRALWRQQLLAVYNETLLLTLAEHGIATAQVQHINPSSQFHGMELAMGSGSELPTYAEVRAEIFHPNADAVLAAPED